LVGEAAGLLAFDEFDGTVVVVVVECVLPFDEFDTVMFEFAGAVVVVVVVVELAFAFIFELMFEFERFALLVLFAVSPPHAAPRAAKPKSAESAIVFFMKKFSCLLQRLILDLLPEGSFAPNSFFFGTNEMILG
jgi:hypothetical protein